MKHLFYIITILGSINSYCQSLSQNEFDKVLNNVKQIVYSTKTNDDFPVLLQSFSVKEDFSKKLKKSIDEKVIEFNKDIHSNNLLMYFFKESNSQNRLLLTVYAFSLIPEKKQDDLSGFGYADYYFILECLIGLIDGEDKVVFENSSIKTEQNEIEQWYLFHHKNYLEVTEPIYKKYQFVPPPPIPLPNTFENSPYHIQLEARKYLDAKEWEKAEALYDKLIEYYPKDFIQFYNRGYVRIMTKKMGSCNDLNKALELGAADVYPELEKKINELKRYCL